jgi:hypothetical protein
MTASGSPCTRHLIDRTLLCNAILDHFQITLYCGPINRPYIPVTLFLLSRPLEQLEFIRVSNLRAETWFARAEISFVPPSRPQRSILPSNLQSRYRGHLFDLKPLFQLPLARGSLHQRSRFTIHSVQEFEISSIQSRKHMCETNIVVIYNQIPQPRISQNSSFLLLRSLRRSVSPHIHHHR